MNRFLNWLCPNFRQALDNIYEQMLIPVSKAQINELNAKGLLLADSIDEDANNTNKNQGSQPIHQENIGNSSDPSIQPDMNVSDSLPLKSNQNEKLNSPNEDTDYSKENFINPDEAQESFIQNLQTEITPDIELVNQENLEKNSHSEYNFNDETKQTKGQEDSVNVSAGNIANAGESAKSLIQNLQTESSSQVELSALNPIKSDTSLQDSSPVKFEIPFVDPKSERFTKRMGGALSQSDKFRGPITGACSCHSYWQYMNAKLKTSGKPFVCSEGFLSGANIGREWRTESSNIEITEQDKSFFEKFSKWRASTEGEPGNDQIDEFLETLSADEKKLYIPASAPKGKVGTVENDMNFLKKSELSSAEDCALLRMIQTLFLEANITKGSDHAFGEYLFGEYSAGGDELRGRRYDHLSEEEKQLLKNILLQANTLKMRLQDESLSLDTDERTEILNTLKSIENSLHGNDGACANRLKEILGICAESIDPFVADESKTVPSIMERALVQCRRQMAARGADLFFKTEHSLVGFNKISLSFINPGKISLGIGAVFAGTHAESRQEVQSVINNVWATGNTKSIVSGVETLTIGFKFQDFVDPCLDQLSFEMLNEIFNEERSKLSEEWRDEVDKTLLEAPVSFRDCCDINGQNVDEIKIRWNEIIDNKISEKKALLNDKDQQLIESTKNLPEERKNLINTNQEKIHEIEKQINSVNASLTPINEAIKENQKVMYGIDDKLYPASDKETRISDEERTELEAQRKQLEKKNKQLNEEKNKISQENNEIIKNLNEEITNLNEINALLQLYELRDWVSGKETFLSLKEASLFYQNTEICDEFITYGDDYVPQIDEGAIGLDDAAKKLGFPAYLYHSGALIRADTVDFSQKDSDDKNGIQFSKVVDRLMEEYPGITETRIIPEEFSLVPSHPDDFYFEGQRDDLQACAMNSFNNFLGIPYFRADEDKNISSDVLTRKFEDEFGVKLQQKPISTPAEIGALPEEVDRVLIDSGDHFKAARKTANGHWFLFDPLETEPTPFTPDKDLTTIINKTGTCKILYCASNEQQKLMNAIQTRVLEAAK